VQQLLAHEIIPQYNSGHKVKEESQNQKKERGFALVGLWSFSRFLPRNFKKICGGFQEKVSGLNFRRRSVVGL
jgi:hypothetical protein